MNPIADYYNVEITPEIAIANQTVELESHDEYNERNHDNYHNYKMYCAENEIDHRQYFIDTHIKHETARTTVDDTEFAVEQKRLTRRQKQKLNKKRNR